MRRRVAVFAAATIGLATLSALAGAAPVVFSTTPISGWSTNGTVRAVLIVGDTAYAGGDFTQVRGPGGSPTAARAHLAAWDVHTGALRTGFTADTDGRVESLASDGTKLFVGGDYTTIKGVTKNRLAAIDLTSGNVITSWTANATSHVYALHVQGTRLYVGGSFGMLAGATRSKIGAVSVATGAIDAAFDPSADDAVHGIATSPDGATVYLGGDFTTVGGLSRPYVAAVASPDGAPTATVFPYPTGGTVHGAYGIDISPSGDRLFGATTENRVEAWSTTTGQQLWDYAVDGDVQAVRYYNGNVYFGFHEGAINDHTVRLLVADATTGALEDYRPPIDSFYGIRAIDATSAGLVLGGEFTMVNGVATQGVAILPPKDTDTVAPTAPGTPTVTDTTATSASLAWSPGSDDTAVAGYRVLRDGVEAGYVGATTLTYTDSGLAPDTEYTYTVETVDGAANTSAPSGPVTAHTGIQLVAAGSVWRYLDNGSDQGTAWRATAFDDSAWASGPAELGYGDGDEATVVGFGGDPSAKYLTTYFRHTFTVVNPATVGSLTLGLVRDDGAVVYVNGTEVARDDLPTGTITSTTRALSAVGGAEESQWFTFPVSPALLHAGTNSIAVEIHQNNTTSKDISFNASLDATATTGPAPATPPSALSVSGVTDTTVGLTWTAPGGTGTTSGYHVYRDGTLVGSPTSTTFTDTGLATGQTYAYTVSAVTDGVESGVAGPVSATTATDPPPGDLHVTGVDETSAGLAWTAPGGAGTTSGYRVYRDGTLVGSPTSTSITDTGLIGGHTYTYTVSAITNGTETSTAGPVTATTAPPTSVVVTPLGDTYVSSGKATRNYGDRAELKLASAGTDYRPYLQFSVGGLTAPPQSATLRLYVTNGSDDGGAWHGITQPWSEDTITWANAPAPAGSPVATLGRVDSGTWVDIDVTSLIAGDGTYSFAATSASSNTARFASRESAFAPQLVIDAAAAPIPPTASFTASRTSGPAPMPVDFTDTSTGGIDTWAWDFGDGGSADVADPSHTFATPGTYTVELTVTNGLGTDTASVTVTVDAPPATSTFVADADAYVSVSAPSKNYGAYTDLKLLGPSGTYEYRPYFGFTVAGLSGPPASAVLRVHVSDAGPSGGTWHLVTDAWTEATIAWSNAPGFSGGPITTLGPVSAGDWIEIDVTSLITGNGTYSFAATSLELNTVMFSSRESAFPAQLVVTR